MELKEGEQEGQLTLTLNTDEAAQVMDGEGDESSKFQEAMDDVRAWVLTNSKPGTLTIIVDKVAEEV